MTPMSSPLDGNGVAAAVDVLWPAQEWNGERAVCEAATEAAITAYLVTASASEERKRRAAGPSSVKWPMPDPLAKYKALAPSQTAVEPVALAQALKNLTEGAEQEDREILYAAASTLTAQAAALVAAERDRDAAILAAGEHARARGEAEGALHVSELAGVVDGWKARAEAAEKRIAELEAGLEQIFRLNDECSGAEPSVSALMRAIDDLRAPSPHPPAGGGRG